MYFSAVVFKNLTRRPVRVFLVVVASSIAVGAMVSLVGISKALLFHSGAFFGIVVLILS